MSRSQFLTLTPSQSDKGTNFIKTRNTGNTLIAIETHCHQINQTIDDWTDCLKELQSGSHEETMKTAKQFLQVDTHAKRTYQTLQKTSRTLDLLLERKLVMLSTISTLTSIQSNLSLEQLAKHCWANPSP